MTKENALGGKIEEIKNAYITRVDKPSLPTLAKEYGCSASALQKICGKAGWVKMRDEHWEKVGKSARKQRERKTAKDLAECKNDALKLMMGLVADAVDLCKHCDARAKTTEGTKDHDSAVKSAIHATQALENIAKAIQTLSSDPSSILKTIESVMGVDR